MSRRAEAGLGHGEKAEAARFKVMTPAEAAKWADVVMVLTPDELQAKLYPTIWSPTCATARRSPSPMASTSISS